MSLTFATLNTSFTLRVHPFFLLELQQPDGDRRHRQGDGGVTAEDRQFPRNVLSVSREIVAIIQRTNAVTVRQTSAFVNLFVH